ncbi:carbohydrate ABC transporter substrate-binding protein [Candidatus Borkfalkia ceftriaxoniphila]|uniref:Carbohydrate ABC transporter substrate-binding protein n=1 Tax=Candidatus Borkfalkia ceftriaxoniphila TaxID=2508949 RepID=A0A4Q2KCF8_9FIRM|nr:ABC transporter substrate-binding protein [Candidatus Borkfalkia ceftriaxoniphila]RXZ62278.1 carbohydrate ABC transporter substrate-binding protein [Candidatus Borkfalkia ceftriaxoniphila]
MKKLSALLLSALLLLGAFAAFTGCGGGNDNPPDTTTDKIDYNGTININLPIKDYPFEDIALKAVAEAYMDKHPETDVKVEGQTSSTYKDWLDSQFAGGSSVTDADIVQTLLISNAYLTTKMVDYSSYLVKPNPYNQNKSWKDTMEEEAYPLSTDRSGIYTLNFTTNMSFFFYNKTLWKQAGLTNADGTDKAPKTWDELLEFCAQIESNTQDKVPFAVGGATYTTGAMSWLLNIYGDQYYRGIADDIHAVAGDYCYDPDIDADWTLDITDKNNDSPSNYTANMLRFYAALMDNQITPKDAKYQAMITNLKKLIPVYCQDNFISNNYYQAEELFWGGNAAMVYNTTDFFNTYKQIFAQRPDAEKFEIGFFPAPPMTGTGDAKPDADTVRSVGGAVGWYGVVKKDKKQNDLVMDFMMFWGSKEGQDIYNQSLKEQGAYISGNSLVKDVDTPAEIYPAKEYEFPGLCHNNPVGQFFGNLASMNGSSYQMFEALCKNVFNGDITVARFGEQLTKAFQNDIPTYFTQMGWKSDAYLTPEKDPRL